MLPQRRPTTPTPPPRERETFSWPPSTDELDAIEVIVLDGAAPAVRTPPRRRRIDVAHWALTVISLAAIGFALVLQFADWRGMRGVGQDATASAAATVPPVPAIAASAASPTLAPLVPPPPPRAIVEPAAYVPARKSRAREQQPRTVVADSPPLRLPESYVQPRLVASDHGGRVRGEVVLGVHVRANGRVGDVDVLSGDTGDGDRQLERAAVAAVKQWRYRPALRDGVPTPARLKVIVKFS